MNLKNGNEKTNSGSCGVIIGSSGTIKCDRQEHQSGPHRWSSSDTHVFLYDFDEPTKIVLDVCGTCFEQITDTNRAEGAGSAKFCAEHIAPFKTWYLAWNGCKKCGYEGPHELRNYNMMWHDGDIHCGRCGAYVRMYDAG